MASRDVAGRETTSTPPNTHQRVSPTGIRSYLQPITALDDESRDTLKSLLRVTADLRRSTSQTHRIRRGSPGAGALGSTLAMLTPRVNEIADKLSEVFTTYHSFPGMFLVSTQFPVFRDVLNGNFNDGGNGPGYSERVHLLEKLMYVTGTLRGHIEMVLEQHEYWRAKLAGEQPLRLARRLNFNEAVDPAQGDQLSAAPLTAQVPLQQELSPPENTFKVSVSLPEEVQTAFANLWEEQKFNDVYFVISGQRIPAHKVVLAAQSQYFECMLFGNMREASMNEIPLEGVPVSAFRKVLQFAYTGTLQMDNVALQAILEVTSVADRFGFVALKEALGDQLSQNHVSLDTVLLLLVHSDIYHLPQLQKCCLQFIENKSHASQVLKHTSLLGLPEESLIGIISRDTFVVPEIEIFKAMQRWKEHNKKSVEDISKLLKCIRLSEFSSAEQIFTEVEPTGLLDATSILEAVRILCKPCVAQTNPRGRKERNRNLFTSPVVVFDSTTPPTYHVPPGPQRLFSHQAPPQQCVADTVIDLGRFHHGHRKPGVSTMIIALDDLYIINYLLLKGYPSMSEEEQLLGKRFSYVVSVSRDKKSWLKLFDYSPYACCGAQHLPFPKQAARYIQMDLKWRQDASRPLPLQFSACCLVDECKPFSFLPNGVIAPQYEHDVVTAHMAVDGSSQMCVAYFRQPYSTAYIRFSLECSDKDVSSVDITVSVGLVESGSGGDNSASGSGGGGGLVVGGSGLIGGGGGGGGLQLGGGLVSGGSGLGGGLVSGGSGLGGGLVSGGSGLVRGGSGLVGGGSGLVGGGGDGNSSKRNLENRLKLQDMDDIPLWSPVSMKLKEKIISYVVVTIRKINRKPPTTKDDKSELTAGEENKPLEGSLVKEEMSSPSVMGASNLVAPASAITSSGLQLSSNASPSVESQDCVPSTLPTTTAATQGQSSPATASMSTAGNLLLKSTGQFNVPTPAPSTGLQLGTLPPVPSSGLQLGTLPPVPSSGLQLGTISFPPAPSTTGLQMATLPPALSTGLQQGSLSLQPAIITGIQLATLQPAAAPNAGIRLGTLQPTQSTTFTFGSSPPPALALPRRRSPNRSPAGQQPAPFVQLQQLQKELPPSTAEPVFKIVDVVCKSSL